MRGVDFFELRLGDVIADGVGNNEVAVGEPLHQRAGAEAIRAVIGEIGLADNEQAGDGAHQVVIHPESAHGVVDGRIDAHRDLVGILVGDALVHLEEVAVALANHIDAEAADGIGEIQVDAESGFADAAAFVADGLGIARSDVAGDQVAEAGIAALEIIIAIAFGYLAGRAFVARLFRHPDTAVVAQRFAHQGEFRLVVTGHRNASGMNLCEARIGEGRAAFVRAPDGGAVGTLGVGGKEIGVAVAAGAEHHRVANMRFDLAGNQIAGDDATSLAINDDEVEHFGAREHLHATGIYLVFESLVRAEQKLLAGLAAGVESARDLRAAEGSVGQRAGILAGEGNALSYALVDDVDADLREPVDIGLARSEVAAFDGVVEQAKDAVTIVVIVFRGVDTALSSDAVRAARRILKAEALHVVAELAQAGGRGCSGEPGTNDEDGVFALVGRIHQLHFEARLIPEFFDGAVGDSRVELHHFTSPAITEMGMEMLPAAMRMATAAAARRRI